MRVFNTFFRTLYLSFTSPHYYADVVRAPFSFSLKYYVGMTVLLSLLVSVVITARWVLPFNSFLADVPDLLVNAYPEELEVTINNGQVSTNVDEPYFIPLSVFDPFEKRLHETVLGINEKDLQYLLVIDTQASIEQIIDYETWALLTWNSISYINDDGNIETVSLEDIENLTINKEVVSLLMSQVRPYLDYFVPLSIGIIIIGYILYGVVRMIYFLILALILWIVASLLKAPLSYGKSYQITLHFSFIPYVLLLLLVAVGVRIPIPYAESMLQLVIGISIVAVIKPMLSENTKSPS